LEDRIAHPELDGNSLMITDPNQGIYRVMAGKECLFAGPRTWAEADGGTGPAVNDFEGFPCAVLLPDEKDLEDEINTLFSDDSGYCTLEEWFDGISRLRDNSYKCHKCGHRYVVLWDDEDYQPHELESV